MVKMSHGLRAKTRKIMTKGARERGLSPITKSLQSFEIGEMANIVIDPSMHKGMPHRRFHGLTGVVTGTQGKAYYVEVKVGNTKKRVLVRREHLKKVKIQ